MFEIYKIEIMSSRTCFILGSKLLTCFVLFTALGLSVSDASHRGYTVSYQPFQDTEQPWIGSHSLRFTANPFINQISEPQAKQFTDTSGSNIEVVSTAESPLSFTSTEPPLEFSNLLNHNITNPASTSITLPMGKRGRKIRRKVKGRRRQTPRSATRYQRKKGKMDERRIRFKTRRPRVKAEFLTTELASEKGAEEPKPGKTMTSDFNTGKIEFLPIDQVSMNPRFISKNVESTTDKGHQEVSPLTESSPELIMITNPAPTHMQPELVDPKNNLVSTDLLDHPEKLNPSYFRNVILKTMMDKLVGVGIATHAPALVRSPKKHVLSING